MVKTIKLTQNEPTLRNPTQHIKGSLTVTLLLATNQFGGL